MSEPINNREIRNQEAQEPLLADIAEEPVRRLSAKATRSHGHDLTEEEIEAAEAEAEAWARRVNCC